VPEPTREFYAQLNLRVGEYEGLCCACNIAVRADPKAANTVASRRTITANAWTGAAAAKAR